MTVVPPRIWLGRCLVRSQDHNHAPAFKLRTALLNSDVLHFGRYALEHLLADARMHDFASAESNAALHFVLVVNELDHVAKLRLVVVLVDRRAEANFLQFNNLLVLAVFFLPLLLLVPEFPVVHNPANRRLRGRSDVHKVEIRVNGHLHRLAERYDTDLLAFRTDKPNLSGADFLVNLMILANDMPPPKILVKQTKRRG